MPPVCVFSQFFFNQVHGKAFVLYREVVEMLSPVIIGEFPLSVGIVWLQLQVAGEGVCILESCAL